MTDKGDKLERVIELLKEPVRIDPALDHRVMAEVRSAPAPHVWSQKIWRVANWFRRGHTVTVSPLGGIGFATAALVVLFVTRSLLAPAERNALTTTAVQGSVVQFVILAPTASTVSLVGDFNDWNVSATPLELVADDRVWSVTVPLAAGRYRYAFLVNGDTWLSDPSAPPVRDDEFGRPGSVVTIGET